MGLIYKIKLRIKNSYRDGGFPRVISSSFLFVFKMPHILYIKTRNRFYYYLHRYMYLWRRSRWVTKFHIKKTLALLGQTSFKGHRKVFFSVIVPVYNHKEYVPLCIQSILSQKHKNFELILVDDASPQREIKAILRQFEAEDSRVRIFFNEDNKGIVASTNFAMKQSRGEYLAFVDCDDMLPRKALMEIAKVTVRKPEADFLFTDRIRIDGAGKKIAKEIYGGRPDLAFANDQQNLIEEMVTSHLKVIKRSAFLKVGLFDPTVSGVQDYDLALKLSEKGNLLYVPKALYLYRWHKNSVTISKRTSQIQKTTTAKRRALERRYLYDMTDYSFKGNAKIKILFVIPWLVVGGAEKVILELAKGLKQSGQYDIYFMATIKGGVWRKKFEELGQVSVLSGSQFPDQSSKIDHLVSFVNKNKIDIVHTSNAEEGFFASPRLWQLYPRPYIIGTLHSDFHTSDGGFVRWVHKYSAHFDKFVFVNQLIQEKVGKYFPDELRPNVIYNGINLETYKKVNVGKNIVLFASRLSGEKQPVHVIKLARELKKLRKDFEVWVAGDGEYEAELKYLCEKWHLTKHVKMLGVVEDVASLYSQAGVTILTSTTEGIPMVFTEALAAGSPIVAYDVGGISEMVEDGKEGLLIEVNKIKEMARAIDNLFANPQLQRRMSKAARQRAKSQFDARLMVKKHKSMYEDLLNGNNSYKSRLLNGPLLSFVILFFNRLEDSKKCIDTIKENVRLPYEIVILDNNSNTETKKYLKRLGKEPNIRVIYESVNLGCPGGRRKAIPLAKGKYIATIDNDMLISPRWAEDMILRLEENHSYVGVVSKVTMLTGLLEFVGGTAKINSSEGTVRFKLIGNGLPAEDLNFMEPLECDWIPGGSTIVKAKALDVAQHCDAYINSFEDNDYALQLKDMGYKLVNCPTASALHHHSSTLTEEELKKEAVYIKTRINNQKLLISTAAFYKRWGLFIEDPVMYEMLGLDGMSREEIIKNVFEPLNRDVRPYAKTI